MLVLDDAAKGGRPKRRCSDPALLGLAGTGHLLLS